MTSGWANLWLYLLLLIPLFLIYTFVTAGYDVSSS